MTDGPKTKVITQQTTFRVADGDVDAQAELHKSSGWEVAAEYPGGRTFLVNPEVPGTVIVLEPHTP